MLRSGVVFLDKPQGWSSRQAVDAVAELFAGTKCGHAGTLDPLATGMLPVLLGEATRFAQYGLGADKTYLVDIDLSYQTDTLDAQGQTLQRFAVAVSQQQVEAVLQGFVGAQQQVPPAFSAIRVGGRRAYKLARRGEDIKLAPRRVWIKSLEMIAWDTPRLRLCVRCSKGTYIRALARDIGAHLGVGGCVVALRRLALGEWPQELMVDIETLRREREAVVRPLAFWLQRLPRLELPPPLARRFVLGQRLGMQSDAVTSVQTLAVFCASLLLGTGVIRKGQGGRPVLQPQRVLPSAREEMQA